MHINKYCKSCNERLPSFNRFPSINAPFTIQKIKFIGGFTVTLLFFTTVRNTLIQINIWQKGEINVKIFEDELLKNLTNALYDVFLEFFLLSTPLCDIPQSLQLSHTLSREPSTNHRSSFSHVRSSLQSSNSSSATTPKFGKSLGKRNFSEPGTPIETRADSPITRKLTDDLRLASAEIANSIPKDSIRTTTNASPCESSQKNLVDSKQRDRPGGALRESPFNRKDSPSLHRKLSGRFVIVFFEN